MSKKKKPVKEPNPNGRPLKYSKELVEEICEKIATGSKGLHAVCKEIGVSYAIVYKWLSDNDKKDFLDRYVRARDAQAELLADEIIDIADDTKNDTLKTEEGTEYPNHEWISRSKLRVDARKWKAARLAPKKYGDKVDVTSAGEKVEAVVIYLPDNNRDKK